MIRRFLDDVQQSLFGTSIDLVSPLAHFLEYLVFGMLLVWALTGKFSPIKATLLAILIASLYGVSDEIHQYFVPGRFCDPWDWVVDTLGAALGALSIGHVIAHRVH